ncbi:hypothetical protein [Shewanella donghaensis]|uniref:hypothetical protein n=1 Tax=Shewanella donghaensis TaxID=238836 RepID=UPI001181F365|nr:hypothetical protein [Shewanella donghaensis]
MKSLNYPRLMQLINKPINSWRSLPSAIMTSCQTVISRLTVAQKLYFIAFIMMLSFDGSALVGVIAMFAMLIEFWPMFTKAWESLAGKAFLLLFYAVIANFSLVWAGSVVNEVTGISAEHLTYTHNLVVLLYMPVWFVVISGMALMLLQPAIMVYFLLLPFLKLVGVKAIRFTKGEYYRKRTLFVRVVLAFVVLTNLFMLGDFENSFESIDPQARMASLLKEEAQQQLQSQESLPNSDSTASAVPVTVEEEPLPEEAEQLLKDITGKSVAEITADDSLNISFTDSKTERRYDLIREAYRVLVRKLVAEFVFYLESNQYSRCHTAAGSKVVELNDYEILEIVADETGKYGYTFVVKQCISPAFPESYYGS